MTELGVIEALKFFVILGFIDIACFIIIEIKDRRTSCSECNMCKAKRNEEE